ncbi:MAG: hypothetical protein QOE90_1497 [Thermoplasmata archaeon]|jgi:hypothetical protein|nr:hypothetical protein [Thermoplasmata archaeon]
MRCAPLILVACLAAVTILLPAGSGASTPSKPLFVVAIANPAGALISWIPGPEQPDGYVIYGEGSSGLIALETVSGNQMQTAVSEFYPAYAVASIQDGVASPATVGVSVVENCLTIEWTPPPPAIGWGDCPSDAGDLPVRTAVWVGLP